MSIAERQPIYEQLENHRKRPLIVYVTSKRPGVDASMASDALPYLIDQLERIPSETKEVDLLIASFGGDPMVAWRIMSLLRDRFTNVAVLIPQSAYSAATLLALGADEIVMHPNSNLGPVDMQISTMTDGGYRHFSTEDISAFVEFVKEELDITDQRHLRKLFEATCREVGTLGVGFTARSAKLAVTLGEKLLLMPLAKDSQKEQSRLVVEKLSRQFHSHAYPVSRREAIDIGLRVNDKQDALTESLMWKIWLDLEAELQEREVFSPTIELMKSKSCVDKLLEDASQLNLPLNAGSPTYYTATIAEIVAAIKGVPTVDFEYITAIIESRRLADQCVTTGKILAARQPDLTIHYNEVTSFRGWKRIRP